ncbi:MAG: hypothetical protein ABS76_11865 [Pelagibacterium sp. SCN 64-44]|nr:MAG: hypothetical protein ABS76_11865 [Pelagibacterium sp. SCN 64-44]
MKLYMSANSPYVRMVRVLLREAGRASEVEEIELNPRDASTGFWSANPVARIPALQLADGTVLAESALICAYLDKELADGRFFAPLHADVRRLALFGLIQGMLDRGVAARTEKTRPGAPDTKTVIDTQLAGVIRVADALERTAADGIGEVDMVDIACGCAMSWIQFRHPELDVLSARPRLANWCSQMESRPSLATTRPTATP